MVDDYIPTTDEILDGYVTMRSREIPGDRVLASVQALSEAERWLAEHDAAKRAEWETELARLKGIVAVAMVTLNGDPYGYRSPSNREAADLLASGLALPVPDTGADREVGRS